MSGNWRIKRYDNANGTNLADKSQPVIRVFGPGFCELMGRWDTLCLPEGAINALDATDEQIIRAIKTDEPIFNY